MTGIQISNVGDILETRSDIHRAYAPNWELEDSMSTSLGKAFDQ